MQALQSHRLVVILSGVGSESFLLPISDDQLDEYHELRQSFTEIRKAAPYHGEVRHLSRRELWQSHPKSPPQTLQ